ncbi:hypothetical protein AAFF_G00366630 [Aldrovandia affinis]|uniref:Uncharacterized protein n=1 Tax=Aldrovandia affinis TaxID=143900 RepID=A0AAD7SHU6_9TELE|nr:hypothetical protein AAFF_G00366630 [Aldrovandia affinis]
MGRVEISAPEAPAFEQTDSQAKSLPMTSPLSPPAPVLISPTPEVNRLSNQHRNQTGSQHSNQFPSSSWQRHRHNVNPAEKKPQRPPREGKVVLMAH